MSFLERYEQTKIALGAAVDESDKMLHMHVGLAIYVAVRLALGYGRSPAIAWVVVLAFEAVNETVDRTAFHSWRRGDTIHDIIDTMLWPTIFTIARLIGGRR